MTGTSIDAKCTIDPNCQGRAVDHCESAGEFACADHQHVMAEVRAEYEPAAAYAGPKLVSLTGNRVHYPALLGQQDTGRTQCARLGRMGARQMRLRFVTGEKWPVNCKTCLNAGAPVA